MNRTGCFHEGKHLIQYLGKWEGNLLNLIRHCWNSYRIRVMYMSKWTGTPKIWLDRLSTCERINSLQGCQLIHNFLQLIKSNWGRIHLVNFQPASARCIFHRVTGWNLLLNFPVNFWRLCIKFVIFQHLDLIVKWMEIPNFLQILWILRDARVYRHITTHHFNFTFSFLRRKFDTSVLFALVPLL